MCVYIGIIRGFIVLQKECELFKRSARSGYVLMEFELSMNDEENRLRHKKGK